MTSSVGRSHIQQIVIALGGVLFAMFPLAGLAVAGQQQAEQASIIGIVVDDSGGVLPGVTVTAMSPALQVASVTTVTNERGEYRVTPLPIGIYVVDYALPGFQTVRREGIILTVNFVARVDAVLKVGSLAETITVSGASPVVDPVSTAASTVLSRATLDVLPSGRSGTVAFMSQAPGVRPQIDIGGQNFSNPPVFHAFGQDNQPWQLMDGVVVSVGKNTSQGGVYWDYNMVEEAKVGTFGSPAEVPTRGVLISGIVKSGGNDFHGTGFFALQDGGLASTNVDDKLRAEGITVGDELVQRTDTSGDLSGRVVRNKLWFYGGYRKRTAKNNTLDCLQPNGDRCFDWQTQSYHTEKVSWQMNQLNRLVGFYNWARKIDEVGASRTVAWESRNSVFLPSHIWKVEWQMLKGNSLVLNLMTSSSHWWGYRMGHGFGLTSKTDSVLQKTWGMSTSDGQNHRDYNRQPLRGSLSWYKPGLAWGDHDIKVGGEHLRRRVDVERFSRSESWKYAQTYLDVPAGGYDSKDYQLQFLNGVANRLVIWNYPAKPIDRELYTGIYAQDSWRARQLTLNLGVRYARDNGFAPAQCRESAFAPGNVAFPAQCFPKAQHTIWQSVVPRLHASLDVTGNGKTVIKGGWGRFMLLRYAEQTQHINWNQTNTAVYVWRDLNGNTEYDPGEVNLSLNGPDFLSSTPDGGASSSNGVPNPNEKQPGTDEYSLSLERELLPSWALRVTGIYSKTFQSQRVQNNLRPYEIYSIPITNLDPGPDNVLGTADDTGTAITYYDYPAAYAGPSFQQPMLVNDSKADEQYKSFDIALSRRLANRWHLYASYSFTKKDIPLIPSDFRNTVDPNSEINNSDTTTERLGKVQGSFRFPLDVTVAADFESRSGLAQRRTVIFRGGRQIPQITLPVEQLGARWWLPTINLVNLNVQKTIALPNRQSATVRMNVFNALNANTVTARTMASGPNFLRTTGILLPRVAEVVVSYKF